MQTNESLQQALDRLQEEVVKLELCTVLMKRAVQLDERRYLTNYNTVVMQQWFPTLIPRLQFVMHLINTGRLSGDMHPDWEG